MESDIARIGRYFTLKVPENLNSLINLPTYELHRSLTGVNDLVIDDLIVFETSEGPLIRRVDGIEETEDSRILKIEILEEAT